MISDSINTIRKELLNISGSLEIIFSEIDYIQREMHKNTGFTPVISTIEG